VRIKLFATAVLLAALAAAPSARAAAGLPIGFAPPVFVDESLAGGEPLVSADPAHGTLIYTAHEGTTHLYRDGITYPLDFGLNYRNQVNIWWSADNGKTWNRDDLATFQGTTPDKSQGFSDPDLAEDEGGRFYNTGIDLANDALFSTSDGGKTWDKGTAQCHPGDRPWLAGGKKDQAWLATNTVEGSGSGHQVFETKDGGSTCSTTGIPDTGTTADGLDYTGNGKIFYDHQRGQLIEPVNFTSGGDNKFVGVGIAKPTDAKFTPYKAAPTPAGVFAHWPSMAIDSAGNVYLTWDTNDRQQGTTGGCTGESPGSNYVEMVASRDGGRTWGTPVILAHPSGGRAFWPWMVAGGPGRVNVVWYQSPKLTDPDCQGTAVSAYSAQVFDATSADPQVTVKDVIGRPVHGEDTTICQGGTTCVATGQDRRLGDFFTNGIDAKGCVLVATGDTTKPDPISGGARPTSLPLFVRQSSGPSLTGFDCATGLPIPPGQPGALAGGALAFGAGGVTAACRDRVAPRSRFARTRVRGSRSRVRLGGTSHDTGCANAAANFKVPGKVSKVTVSVARTLSAKRCRFLLKDGSFSPARSCLRTSYLPARGTTKWSFSFRARFPRGRYKAWVRGVDARGNVEKKNRKRNYTPFRIR
jgi:hypothetical protein